MGSNAGASLYLENKLLDHTLRNTSYTSPTTVYGALFSTVDSSGETNVARVALTFAAASGFSITTSGATTFAAVGALTEVWSFGIFDAASGGNLLAHGPCAQAMSFAASQVPSFAAGGITVAMSSIGAGYYATTYYAKKVLDHTFRHVAYSSPATVYMALYTDSLANTEVSATGYARQALTVSAASQGSTSNTGNVNFTVTASYGSVPTAGICDASTSGNQLMWAPLDRAVATTAGDTFRFDTALNLITVAID